MLRALQSVVFVLPFLVLSATAALAGTITQIIRGRTALIVPQDVAVDDSGNAYIVGFQSNNAFKITPDGIGLLPKT